MVVTKCVLHNICEENGDIFTEQHPVRHENKEAFCSGITWAWYSTFCTFFFLKAPLLQLLKLSLHVIGPFTIALHVVPSHLLCFPDIPYHILHVKFSLLWSFLLLRPPLPHTGDWITNYYHQHLTLHFFHWTFVSCLGLHLIFWICLAAVWNHGWISLHWLKPYVFDLLCGFDYNAVTRFGFIILSSRFTFWTPVPDV